jgi:hypothetical protein
MKKLILILAIATFMSCSKDEPVNNCYRIDSKEVLDGQYYVNGKVVTQAFWYARKVGEIYCPPTKPSY